MDKNYNTETRRCEICDDFFSTVRRENHTKCPKCRGLYCRSCGRTTEQKICPYCGYKSLNQAGVGGDRRVSAIDSLRARVAELEQANADLNKQLITAWALVQEHQMYQAKQGEK